MVITSWYGGETKARNVMKAISGVNNWFYYEFSTNLIKTEKKIDFKQLKID